MQYLENVTEAIVAIMIYVMPSQQLVTSQGHNACKIYAQVEFERSTKKRIGLSTDFSSTISADSEPGPIYPGTHAVTCKRRLVHEFFC